MRVSHINKEKSKSIKQGLKTEDVKWLSNALFKAIFGYEDLLENAQSLADSNTVVISLTEPNSEKISITHPESFYGFHSILEEQFWDLEEDFNDYKVLTDAQGASIRKYIEEHKDKQFVIHCRAGVSRSAAVGLAVECLVNYEGDRYAHATSHSDIKGFWRYAPNLTVFDKIIGG